MYVGTLGSHVKIEAQAPSTFASERGVLLDLRCDLAFAEAIWTRDERQTLCQTVLLSLQLSHESHLVEHSFICDQSMYISGRNAGGLSVIIRGKSSGSEGFRYDVQTLHS